MCITSRLPTWSARNKCTSSFFPSQYRNTSTTTHPEVSQFISLNQPTPFSLSLLPAFRSIPSYLIPSFIVQPR